MIKGLLATGLCSLLLFNPNTCAEETFLNKLDKEQTYSMEETNSILDNTYYAIGLNFPIIPSDLSAAIGYELGDGIAEVELYVSARVSRFFSDEHDLHLPVGARVRVALNGTRTLYLEYQREFTVLEGNEYGLLETPNLVSIVGNIGNSGLRVSCGLGNSVHHAWADENHEPEDQGYFECRVLKKF